MVKKFFVLCLFFILVGCKPQDPSAYDVKSPCVSHKKEFTNGVGPCIKRTPLGNKLV